MANALLSTVVLVNSEPSDSVSSFNFAMCAFASKYFPMELVPCSDGCRRTWWQMIHMMPGQPVSSIPKCKYKRHEGAYLEIFQPIGWFEHTLIDAHQASDMIWILRLLKSGITTGSLLEDIIISSEQDIYRLGIRHGCRKLETVLFGLRDFQRWHYYWVERWFLNIDSWATCKPIVRPVRHCMHSCWVVYSIILYRLTVKNGI